MPSYGTDFLQGREPKKRITTDLVYGEDLSIAEIAREAVTYSSETSADDTDTDNIKAEGDGYNPYG